MSDVDQHVFQVAYRNCAWETVTKSAYEALHNPKKGHLKPAAFRILKVLEQHLAPAEAAA